MSVICTIEMYMRIVAVNRQQELTCRNEGMVAFSSLASFPTSLFFLVVLVMD